MGLRKRAWRAPVTCSHVPGDANLRARRAHWVQRAATASTYAGVRGMDTQEQMERFHNMRHEAQRTQDNEHNTKGGEDGRLGEGAVLREQSGAGRARLAERRLEMGACVVAAAVVVVGGGRGGQGSVPCEAEKVSAQHGRVMAYTRAAPCHAMGVWW